MTKTCTDHLMFKKPWIHVSPFCWHAGRGIDLSRWATEKCQLTIKTIYKFNSFRGQGATLRLVEINFFHCGINEEKLQEKTDHFQECDPEH